jgi:hypothetical protein
MKVQLRKYQTHSSKVLGESVISGNPNEINQIDAIPHAKKEARLAGF